MKNELTMNKHAQDGGIFLWFVVISDNLSVLTVFSFKWKRNHLFDASLINLTYQNHNRTGYRYQIIVLSLPTGIKPCERKKVTIWTRIRAQDTLKLQEFSHIQLKLKTVRNQSNVYKISSVKLHKGW